MKKINEKRIAIKHPGASYSKKLILKQFRLPNGVAEVFFIDSGNDSAQILPITEDNKVVLVKQFRPGTEQEELELPGGGLNQEEEGHTAAARELKEETGYEGNLHYLGSANYSPYSTGKRYMFVATECKRIAKVDLDPNEFLSVCLLSLEDFRELIKKGGTIRGQDVAYLGLDYLNKL